MALGDRFEVLKDIGDGSFGSVCLARVRSAGSNVARRGTVVGTEPERWGAVIDEYVLDCHQDDEEDVRVLHTLFGVARSSFSTDTTAP